MVRRASEVDVRDEGTQLPFQCDALVRVTERGGTIFVEPACSFLKLWTVVRSGESEPHTLRSDDTIRLGRVRLRVRQLVTDARLQPDLGLDDTSFECHATVAEQHGTEAKTCRICLAEGLGDNESGPLIRPCQCAGSIGYVHLLCLREWTRNRSVHTLDEAGSFSYRPLPCELCKSNFPMHLVGTDGTRSPLMELPSPRPPCVVLETETAMSDGIWPSRCVHVMSLAEQPLMMGRGHESRLRIGDVSISRCHASIRYDEGRFVLSDNRSKFGTLVAQPQPLEIAEGTHPAVQVGRTVLFLSRVPLNAAMPECGPESALALALGSTSEDFFAVAEGRAEDEEMAAARSIRSELPRPELSLVAGEEGAATRRSRAGRGGCPDSESPMRIIMSI